MYLFKIDQNIWLYNVLEIYVYSNQFLMQEYHEEILVKEKYKKTLLEDGQELLKISKGNQISNIQCKIKKTRDKWNHLLNTLRFR